MRLHCPREFRYWLYTWPEKRHLRSWKILFHRCRMLVNGRPLSNLLRLQCVWYAATLPFMCLHNLFTWTRKPMTSRPSRCNNFSLSPLSTAYATQRLQTNAAEGSSNWKYHLLSNLWTSCHIVWVLQRKLGEGWRERVLQKIEEKTARCIRSPCLGEIKRGLGTRCALIPLYARLNLLVL